jgi:hypothetical protein
MARTAALFEAGRKRRVGQRRDLPDRRLLAGHHRLVGLPLVGPATGGAQPRRRLSAATSLPAAAARTKVSQEPVRRESILSTRSRRATRSSKRALTRCSSLCSCSVSAGSRSRLARATKVDVIAATIIATKAIPSSITNAATMRPEVCVGVTSPVADGRHLLQRYHTPRQMVGYSSCSSTLMPTPLVTTTSVVAKTITLAGLRTDTGSRRKRVIRRSISLGRPHRDRTHSPDETIRRRRRRRSCCSYEAWSRIQKEDGAWPTGLRKLEAEVGAAVNGQLIEVAQEAE